MRLLDEIESETFKAKSDELRKRDAEITLQLESIGRQNSEDGELAVKVFELSQALREGLNADIAEKRQLLEIICLNFSLDDVTLVPTITKPFGEIAEGLFMFNLVTPRVSASEYWSG